MMNFYARKLVLSCISGVLIMIARLDVLGSHSEPQKDGDVPTIRTRKDK